MTSRLDLAASQPAYQSDGVQMVKSYGIESDTSETSVIPAGKKKIRKLSVLPRRQGTTPIKEIDIVTL